MFKKRIKTVSFNCGGTLYYEVEEDHMVFHKILLKLGYRFEPVKVREAWKDACVWWSEEKARTREVWNENAWARLLRKMVSNLAIPNQDLAEQLRTAGYPKQISGPMRMLSPL